MLNGYVPDGMSLAAAKRAASCDPKATRVARAHRGAHVRAMLALQDRGAVTFDYGNNLRTEARDAGVADAFRSPASCPSTSGRCSARGGDRSAGSRTSGEAADIARTDELVLEMFGDDRSLATWIREGPRAHRLPGAAGAHLLAWLRRAARFALAVNELVRNGELAAPIVFGRDHLDCGSVASPYRETEAMADGSDAIADWPLLNAMLNVACGATWVSIHHGGGVGIGKSIHAGQVTVADGSPDAARRIERVMLADPGIGVARHADAGYERAREIAKERGVDLGGA
jgi:urocanate hydratase